jgi:hypothetical protein
VHLADEAGRPLAGVELTVTYRPGSRVSRSVSLGRTDARGEVTWTPEDAGLASLESAGERPQSKAVSVRFDGVPWKGLAVMIVAGWLLVGGSIRRFVTILKGSAF